MTLINDDELDLVDKFLISTKYGFCLFWSCNYDIRILNNFFIKLAVKAASIEMRYRNICIVKNWCKGIFNLECKRAERGNI
ncbi:hypothetical protein D3C84_607070 [compost metagenome]